MPEVLHIAYDSSPGIRPLYDYPGLEISRTRNLAQLRDSIAWMATCGDVDYRRDSIPFVEDAFEAAGLPRDAMEQYSPLVEVWTDDCAITEKRYLAESRFLALPVLDTSEGQASTAEVPFGVIGGLLRGQRIFTLVEPGWELENPRLPIGRYITTSYIQAFNTLLAPIGIQNFTSMPDLNQAVADAAIEYLTSEQPQTAERVVLKKPLLNNHLVITGSGNEALQNKIAQLQSGRLKDLCAVTKTFGLGFDRQIRLNVAREVDQKTRSAVNIVAISAEQLSYGAVNEIGWLALGAVLKDQALGIYMERCASPHASDVEVAAANRQRQLVMSHLGRLLQDFPWLTARIKAFTDYREAARWSVMKMDEHQDWRDFMGV